MPLQGTLRGQQALKPWCVAAACHGESPEACRALRGMPTLPQLAGDGSAWPQPSHALGGRTERGAALVWHGHRYHGST